MRPLPLKFDRVIRSFLKLDRRHEAYRHEKKCYLHDTGYFLNSTSGIGLFGNQQENYKNSNKGHCYSLKSTGDIIIIIRTSYQGPFMHLKHRPLGFCVVGDR